MKASLSLDQQLSRKTDNQDPNILNAEILNKINTQNKDIKVAMSKLIENNKMLQK